MSCATCGDHKEADQYLNCAECREVEAEKRRDRYAIQQYKINPLFEPKTLIDGETKMQRLKRSKEQVKAATTSCPERSMFSPEYESTPTYCGLCKEETLERNLFKCLCSKCRALINYKYPTGD